MRIADEQPVFLAHGGRADGVFDKVGVDLRTAVTQASRSGVGVNGGDVQRTREGRLWFAGSPESLAYDEDGNLTSDGRWTYAWDAENRLKSMEIQSAAISAGVPAQRLEFAYDAQGRRVRKVVRSLSASGWVVTSDLRYLYDGWNLIAEMDVGWMNGYLGVRNLRSYAWGYDLSGTEQGAGGVGGLVLVKQWSTTVNNGQQPSTSALAPCYDGNGNILAYMDCATGAVAQRMEYDAFGNELTLDSVLNGGGSSIREVPFRFSTKYTDAETNLSYYGYRYYSAEMGRWLNRDPIAEKGGLNLYGMVRNDVVNKWDYLGWKHCDCAEVKSQLDALVPTAWWWNLSSPGWSWTVGGLCQGNECGQQAEALINAIQGQVPCIKLELVGGSTKGIVGRAGSRNHHVVMATPHFNSSVKNPECDCPEIDMSKYPIILDPYKDNPIWGDPNTNGNVSTESTSSFTKKRPEKCPCNHKHPSGVN